MAWDIGAFEFVAITRAPGVGSLTFTGYASTCVVTSAGVTATPGAATVTLSGLAPVVLVAHLCAPGVVALTYTGQAPVARQEMYRVAGKRQPAA